MKKLHHTQGLIPAYVKLLRNHGTIVDDAGVIVDLPVFEVYPNFNPEHIHTCMYSGDGNRISITNNSIVAEVAYQLNDSDESETPKWQKGVYHYREGEGYLFSSKFLPGIYEELQQIESDARAPIAIKRVRAQYKTAVVATWRQCYLPQLANFSYLGCNNPGFNQKYDLDLALVALSNQIQELIKLSGLTLLKNPIQQYRVPEKGSQGYLSAKLCHLLKEYFLILKWVWGSENLKQGRFLLTNLEGDIDTELQKLQNAVKKQKEQSPQVSSLRLMIEQGLMMKREYRNSFDVESPKEGWPHHFQLVENNFQIEISGYCADGSVYLAPELHNLFLDVRSQEQEGPYLFAAPLAWICNYSGGLTLEKLMEPGVSLPHLADNNKATVLVAYVPANAQDRSKIIRRLHHLMVKWMVYSDEHKDLVILS